MATFVSLLVALAVLAGGPTARPDRVHLDSAHDDVIVGGSPAAAKAAGDTILLMGPWGSGATWNGQFEDPLGNPAWNGWTSKDLSVPEGTHWQASPFMPVAGAWSAWCGEDIPSCGGDDPDGGYGNNWDETLEWRGRVDDPNVGCTVTVTALVSHDVEPGYDYCYVSVEKADRRRVDLWIHDGTAVAFPLQVSSYYGPTDYTGEGDDEVVVQFRMTSDGGWSDADCSYPSAGAFRVDDVVIATDNGDGAAHDFEDGTLGPLTAKPRLGVGDFAQVWSRLRDADPCVENPSPQVAFIDDGRVVPGTGGSTCINWCYGPGGYIVNTTGGLAGPDHHIYNYVYSPVMAVPEGGYEGCVVSWDCYRHEDLTTDAPGIGYLWMVRGTPSPDPADIESGSWGDRDSGIHAGGPDYFRYEDDVSDLLGPSPRWVQLRLGVWEWGWVWGWIGDDGYPAPYYDNVRVAVFRRLGPTLGARSNLLAQDGFPATGRLDLADPGSNSVRFDMARNISLPSHQRIDPGDSVVFFAVPSVRGGALAERPRLHYRLHANPLFDPYRTAGLPAVGSVACDTLRNGPIRIEHGWCADLPDTGFLFPGDVLHYCFTASEEVDGIVRTSILPADTTGFSRFDGPLAYDSVFTVRALPSLRDDGPGGIAQPGVLFWHEFGNRGGGAEWHGALAGLGFRCGVDYDVFDPNNGSLDGNGLGSRATPEQLGGYAVLLYASGDMAQTTIANGDYGADPSPDAQLLTAWLEYGGRGALFTGDSLADDLSGSGTVGAAFLQDVMGLAVDGADLRPLVAGQATPVVVVTGPDNPVFANLGGWLALGACPDLNRFDAVIPAGGARRLAEFTGPGGIPGVYPWAAATLNVLPGGSAVVSLPMDLMSVGTDPREAVKSPAPLAARARLLADVLAFFGVAAGGEPSRVPGAAAFAVTAAPNPFNAVLRLEWALPRPGRLTVKVFDVRGRLVRTLVDAHRDAGPGAVAWRGDDERGAAAASGVYFYEARWGADVRVGRVTLLK